MSLHLQLAVAIPNWLIHVNTDSIQLRFFNGPFPVSLSFQYSWQITANIKFPEDWMQLVYQQSHNYCPSFFSN